MCGTAYSKIHTALQPFNSYTLFCSWKTSPAVYQKWIEQEIHAMANTLSEDQINLSARFPRDLHDFVRRAVAQCCALDIIDDGSYDETATEHHLEVMSTKYAHDNYLTYIFPEETALLYAVVRNFRPRRAAFMGSYYGYWAASAKAAFSEMDIALFDLDSTVMELAIRNFEELGLASNAVFEVGDAEALVKNLRDIDLLVLDATGPNSNDIPTDYRDKAIYYPHLGAAFDMLKPGGLLVAHNVILSNFTNGSYFEAKQQNYREQYTKFLPFVQEHFRYIVVDTTQGVMVARKL